MPEKKRVRLEENDDEGGDGQSSGEDESRCAASPIQELDETEEIDRRVDILPGEILSEPRTLATRECDHHESPPLLPRWAEELRRVPKRRRIVHDVITVGSYGEAQESYFTLSKRLEEPRAGYAFAAISFHISGCRRPHLHVVHDCSWSNGTCRCVAFAGFRRRPNRSSVWSCNTNGWDYFRLVDYLNKEPRRLEYLKVAGTSWLEYIGAEVLELPRHCRCGTAGAVEVLFGAFQGPSACDDCTRSVGGHPNTSQVYATETTPRETRRCEKAHHTEESLFLILSQNPVSPLTNITRTPMWLERADLRFIRLDDKRLQRAIQVLNEQLCNWTTLDYISLYQKTNPLFDAPHGNISQYYMDVPSSFAAIVELLEYQLGPEVPDFVTNLYNLLERRVPKKNCMEIVSPPSAGKNFFFDAVVSFYINRGTIHNFNKYSSFPLQDAVGKRILIWNEPNCESSAFETIKKIFGGDVDSVAVKYSSDMTVTRTPVIVLSNHETFPRIPAFNHRMFRYRWKTCPELLKYDKKVNPLALINLFDAYLDDHEYTATRRVQ
ncbi:uncharacterized protein LOC121835583 [Ixodes scapularis]|uniref:uncharacterized protein LOC120839149 n=1 Tax=Ixodes scapularis TaxID=6945 RepID=UPI001AD6B888|nr:uncharacterized protein LOC120839149 [Ixodes scapularis]XP_042145959.1 uncharacterized protein LOC121835583 [Ixodes scapularis]